MGKLKKPLTQKQKDNATSKRLFLKYGITLDEYWSIFRGQGGVCKVCQREPTNRRLHTEHDHKLSQTKILSVKVRKGEWQAFVEDLGITRQGKTKSDALKKVRHALKRKSIRGLTCWHCNAGLKNFRDDPELLESAALYLRNYQIGPSVVRGLNVEL